MLRFAIANGFRNIQNLMQKMKRGKVSYHLVEVMACPSGSYHTFVLPACACDFTRFFFVGCVNGGAQIRPQHLDEPMREVTMQLTKVYRQLPQSDPENCVTERIFRDFFDGKHSDKSKALLHTKYRAVEKVNTVLNIKW